MLGFGLYVLAFGSIAWFRFAAPLLATEEHQLRVSGVEPLSPGVFSIHLSVLPDLLDSDLFICGPEKWADLVVRDARAAGLPARRIHVERFA
ncbi:hypothetical protein [Microbacterium testaceum]|uniref:hypothetical protein n=1 Tax=Microbacterium testaceum TaxID=2033 RepID=UPI00124528D3|nr:hypothetical protein [Microbacterium testaceum]